MRKRLLLLTVLVFACSFIFSKLALARPLELNFNLFISAKHNRYVYCHTPWLEMLQKSANGQLKITPYLSNSLTPITEKFDATVDGIADMSEGITWISAGRFPLSDMLCLPELGLETATKSAKAWWHLYKTMPEMQKEYAGVKMLFFHTSPKLMIATVKKPVRKLEDLKGLKIWVTGKIPVSTAKALGFTPVALAPGEVYLALDKGVIDGCFADFEILTSRRFYEVTKYITTNLYMNHTPFWVVMNQGVWDGLPGDIRKVFEEHTGDWAVEYYGNIRDKEEIEAAKIAVEKGMELIELPESELVKMKKLVEPVKAAYVEELEAQGLPGKRAFTELMKFGNQ